MFADGSSLGLVTIQCKAIQTLNKDFETAQTAPKYNGVTKLPTNEIEEWEETDIGVEVTETNTGEQMTDCVTNPEKRKAAENSEEEDMALE